MARLPRFENYRFVGTRDDMVVHDCDDPEQFARLAARTADDDLLARNLIQSFGPDELSEARNRGFSSQ
jgi:hypothetical protein